jgi:hypothetical protein
MMYAALIALIMVGVVVGMLIFNRRKDEAWEQLAVDMGGEFIKGALFRASRVRVPLGNTMVTLDTYSVPSGDTSTSYTRFRATFSNPAGLQFSIRREGLIGRLDKALGLQNIDLGEPEFDRNFVVQGKPASEVQRLLSGIGLRQMLQQQKSISLGTRGNELYLEVQGVVRDVARLRSLLSVLKEVLSRV